MQKKKPNSSTHVPLFRQGDEAQSSYDACVTSSGAGVDFVVPPGVDFVVPPGVRFVVAPGVVVDLFVSCVEVVFPVAEVDFVGRVVVTTAGDFVVVVVVDVVVDVVVGDTSAKCKRCMHILMHVCTQSTYIHHYLCT